MKTFGQRVKEKRLQLNMTQTELAELAGYSSKSAISNIETDNRNLTQSKIKVLADILNTTPAYLLGWDEDKIEKERLQKYKEFFQSDLNSLIFEEIQDLTNSQKYELIGIIKKMKNP